MRKSGVSATNRPSAARSPRLTSLPRSPGFCRVSCGNPLKRSLPWPASPRNSPITSPPRRPRRWCRPRRATRSVWPCGSCSGPAFRCRVPVPPACGPPAQPRPSHPQPEARRTGQQGEAGPRGSTARRPGGVTGGPEVVPSQGPAPAALRHQQAVGQQEHDGGGGRHRNRPCPGLIHRGKGIVGQLMRVLLRPLGPRVACARRTEVGGPERTRTAISALRGRCPGEGKLSEINCDQVYKLIAELVGGRSIAFCLDREDRLCTSFPIRATRRERRSADCYNA